MNRLLSSSNELERIWIQVPKGCKFGGTSPSGQPLDQAGGGAWPPHGLGAVAPLLFSIFILFF
jgi:hypothetical protein